jgi:hypothetical protein
MLEVKAEKRAKKNQNPGYEPFIVDSKAKAELNDLEFMCKIKEVIINKKPCHYDFILIAGIMPGHCTAMQIDFDGEKAKLFYFDASRSSENFEKAESYVKLFVTHNIPAEFYHFTKGGIQTDTHSCAIYSIQNLNNLSNMVHYSNTEITAKDSETIPHAAFIKNIQSTSNYKELYDKTVDKQGKTSLGEYINKYLITMDISQAGDASTKTRNVAVEYKKHKYLKAVIKRVQPPYSMRCQKTGGFQQYNLTTVVFLIWLKILRRRSWVFFLL